MAVPIPQINYFRTSHSPSPNLTTRTNTRNLSHNFPNFPNRNPNSKRLAAIQTENVVINRKSAINRPDVRIQGAEEVERAVRAVNRRAEAVAERITEKMRERSRRSVEELISGEGKLIEIMSREIVKKFMEKPIGYLRNGEGDVEEKVKDLDFLLCVLEESLFENEK